MQWPGIAQATYEVILEGEGVVMRFCGKAVSGENLVSQRTSASPVLPESDYKSCPLVRIAITEEILLHNFYWARCRE